MKRIIIATAVISLAALHAHSQSAHRGISSSSSSHNKTQEPTVLIQPQPDAPLRLSVQTKWVAEGRGYEIFVAVENVNGRVIRAYTTRHTPSGTYSGCSLWNLLPGKVLQPGRSDGKSTWRSYDPAAPPLTYSVDFVEFTDDSTWGADICQSAEQLAGQRAGGRAAADFLQGVLQAGGPEAVMKAIEDRRNEISPPAGRSPVWEEGFRLGTRAIADRIHRAVQEWGLTEIENALRRPYDASGANQR